MLEFYPPGEEDSFDSSKPALEVFGNKATPKDIAGDLSSHYLAGGIDPVISKTYKQFEDSLTPEQKKRLQEQYQWAQQNEGEKRPYNDWYKVSGLPAYFRGYAFGQWENPEKLYTPDQIKLFDNLNTYLKTEPKEPASGNTFDQFDKPTLLKLGAGPEARGEKTAINTFDRFDTGPLPSDEELARTEPLEGSLYNRPFSPTFDPHVKLEPDPTSLEVLKASAGNFLTATGRGIGTTVKAGTDVFNLPRFGGEQTPSGKMNEPRLTTVLRDDARLLERGTQGTILEASPAAQRSLWSQFAGEAGALPQYIIAGGVGSIALGAAQGYERAKEEAAQMGLEGKAAEDHALAGGAIDATTFAILHGAGAKVAKGLLPEAVLTGERKVTAREAIRFLGGEAGAQQLIFGGQNIAQNKLAKRPALAGAGETAVTALPFTGLSAAELAMSRPRAKPAERTAPESRETLQLQEEAVLAGRQRAMLFPPGVEPLEKPEGLKSIITEAGTFHYDPKRVTGGEILQAVDEGKVGEVLGLGKQSKAEALAASEKEGVKPVAVTEETPDGTEVKTAVASPAEAPVTLKAMEKAAKPGNTVRVADPNEVVAERLKGLTAEERARVKAAEEPFTQAYEGQKLKKATEELDNRYQAAQQDTPAYSKREAGMAGGVATGEAYRATKQLRETTRNAPRTVVVEDASDLPPRVITAMEERAHDPKSVKGIYLDGKMYLIAGNLGSGEEAAATWRHEVAHDAIRGRLGSVYGRVLDQFHSLFNTAKDLKANAKLARHYFPEHAGKGDVEVMRALTPEQRREFVEERLARLAEADPASNLWRRFVFQLKKVLNGHLGANFKFNEADAKALIERRRTDRLGALESTETRNAGPRFALKDKGQTETPEFKKWFGDSKVTNEDGSPRVVYHGTHGDFNEFDRLAAVAMGKGRSPENPLRVGNWFTSEPTSTKDFGPRQIAAYLNIEHPNTEFKSINQFGKAVEAAGGATKFREQQKEFGYDGILFPQEEMHGFRQDIYVAFEPEQIKSATGNTGAFDPKNPDIRFNKGEEADLHGPGETPKEPIHMPKGPGLVDWKAREEADEAKKQKDLEAVEKGLFKPDVGPREESLFKAPFQGTRRLYLGAADRFLKTPGLEFMGEAMNNWYDYAHRNQGLREAPFRRWMDKYTPSILSPVAKLKARGIRQTAYGEFLTYFQAVDRASEKKPAQAQERRALKKDFGVAVDERSHELAQRNAANILNEASPAGKELIQLWQKAAREMQAENERLKVVVWDDRTQSFRPIGTIQNYFPRSIRPEIRQLMRNPYSNLPEWNQLVRALMNGGFIDTPEKALNYLQSALGNTSEFSYLGNIEAARYVPLPTVLYDYSFNTAMRYIRAHSERTAQIEAFGQKIRRGEQSFGMDSFDVALKRVTNPETAAYLSTIRDQTYGKQNRGAVWDALAAIGDITAGNQLGNPRTAIYNLLSGVPNNFITFGVKNSLRSLFYDMWRAGNGPMDMIEKGIILDQVDAMVGESDAVRDKSGEMWSPKVALTVRQRARAYSSFMLEAVGFNAAERFIRRHGMVAEKLFLEDALRQWGKNPNSMASRNYLGFFERNQVDIGKLMAEQGRGPETDRFLRTGLAAAQGGYRINQVPAWTNGQVGRVLFKYFKWGTQMTRQVDLNVIKPLLKPGKVTYFEDDGTARTVSVPHNPLPALRFLLLSSVAGMGARAVNEWLFGVPNPSKSWAQIAMTMDKDGAKALGQVVDKVADAVIANGLLGIANIPLQSFYDFSERKQFRDPLHSANMAIFENSWNFLKDVWDTHSVEGLKQAAEDFAKNTASIVRTTEEAGARLLGAVGVEFDAQKKILAKQDARWLAVQTRAWSAAMNIPSRRSSPGTGEKSEHSPLYRNINEALLIGDVGQAREVMDAALEGAKSEEERKALVKGIKSSVAGRRPIRAGSSPASPEMQELFWDWARENLPAGDVERLKQIDDRYQRAARQLEWLSDRPVNERKMEKAREKLRSYQNR